MKRTHLSILLVLGLAGTTLYAAPIPVNCNTGGSISATLAALAQAGNTRNITIFVKGTCKENIVIGGFDHLVLQGSPIATLQDASNGTAVVVTIYSSFDVLLQGFTITGGFAGVNCIQYSSCNLAQNIVQQATTAGVRFARSNGVVQTSTIVNNAAEGIRALNGSTLATISNLIKDNGGAGILVLSGSNLTEAADTIQENGFGIRAISGSVVRASGLSMTGNASDGVQLEGKSSAEFDGDNVITGNGGDGVAIHDLSFASFAGDNISGNLTQPDVACYPQFSATRGVGTVAGTTNCNEPSSQTGKN